MKKIFAVLLAGAGITYALTSCNPDSIAPTSSDSGSARLLSKSNPDVSVVEGRIRFANSSVFNKVLVNLRDPKQMESWEKQYVGFKSMRTAYNDLINYDLGKALQDGSISAYEGTYRVTEEQDGQKSYDRAIIDQALATVLNGQGVAQIGDSLYRVNEDWLIALPIQFKAELKADQPAHGVRRAVVHQSIKYTKSDVNARLFSDHDLNYIEYHPNGLKLRRFRTLGWSTNYAFPQQYWSAGYRVWHQRNDWFGWGGEPADNISVTAKVTINGQLRYYPGGVIPSQGTVGAANVQEVEFRYAEDWTSASVGLCRVEFTWSGKGNGSISGQPIYRGYSGSWEENI